MGLEFELGDIGILYYWIHELRWEICHGTKLYWKSPQCREMIQRLAWMPPQSDFNSDEEHPSKFIVMITKDIECTPFGAYDSFILITFSHHSSSFSDS